MNDLKLIEAVKACDHAGVRATCESQEQLRQVDEYGWTALHWAASKGDAGVVRLLLERGADVFKEGSDLRTPYKIAVAAGHAEVCELLRDAGEKAGGEHADRAAREYCSAYRLSELSRFSGWIDETRPPGETGGKAHGGEQERADESDAGEEFLFIHHDFTVTTSMWHGEGVRFSRVTPEWKAFCAEALNFKVADELDLLVPSRRES
jgi:hypothetical protein